MRYEWDQRRERRELLAEINRAFRAARQREAAPAEEALHPALDFVADGEAYQVLVDLPGVTRELIEVLVERGALTIRGKKPVANADGRVVRRERQYGQFARLVSLPEDADLADVTATLRQGELVVRVGRKVAAGARRVEVTEG
jgi:HSP20 family protein